MRAAEAALALFLCGLAWRDGRPQEVGQGETPVIGKNGTRCYDDFGRPQRCIPEFENAAFNVLMEATNTCGENGEMEYCVQTGVTGIRKSCEICFPNQHHARLLTDFHNDDDPTWWQSETMFEGIQYPNQVNLTLRFNKAFDVTYVRLWFYSPRPESFYISKKTTENGPWIPWQYYSATCRDTYSLPDTTHTARGEDTRALCTSEYSDISPLKGGNVAFGTIEGRPSAYYFDSSPELQEWVTATEIMITLDRINTFGDEVFGDEKVLRSYFYAVADVAVGARCKCNGHASECVASTGPDGARRRVCRCEHNTAGADCGECLPFYNDAPWARATARDAHECKQCNCNGYSNRCVFDQKLYEQTGHGGHCLDCSANRDGPNCERCRPNYFMRDDGFCVACECDEVGSRSLQCNTEGKCQCKPGVTGEKCDKCLPTHHDFSSKGCKNCGCSEQGSKNNEPACDPYFGTCYCKENVEGKQCKECKPGFFNLDYDNNFGCTPCFCYGHSSQCKSAPGYSKYLLESTFAKSSEKWIAEDELRRKVEIKYEGISQSIGVQASGEDTVYFIAPERFLGDQRTSYNQLLRFSFRVGDNRAIPTATDIVLEGNGVSVTNTIFAQQNRIPTIATQDYKFRLHEHPDYGWQPRLTSRAFMSILTNLTAIKIKGTYAPKGVGFLDDFKLETASRGAAGQPALWIESCDCPQGYVGQYCESCAPGYRHSPALGGPFMNCIPCDCNNHASICDSETGRCICQHNTGGENCELCAKGYYGNALEGTPNDCQPCGCPNGGACIEIDDNITMCTECPTGYSGLKCDSCSDGYFGDPTGIVGEPSECQLCDCNSNIDLNAIGNCNTTTGECLKCIHNTGGSKCDVCLPGYYGNALVLPKGDCKKCECYSEGTEAFDSAPICDQISGACQCRPHVVGRNCDQCEIGYFNIHSGEGCQLCNCDPIGSFNQSCDLITGQCYCRPGVTGLRCDHCEARKYSFSTEGCKGCNCDKIGSRDLQCDNSGQCPCLENVEGMKCDRCKENKYDRQRGCIDCPDCYNLVQAATKTHNEKLVRLTSILDEIERQPTVISDEEFPEELREVQEEIDEFSDQVKNATGEHSLLQEMQNILDREKDISRTVSEIDENIYIAKERTSNAAINLEHADGVLLEVEDKLEEVEITIDSQAQKALEDAWQRSEFVGQQSEKMTQIAHKARDLAEELDLRAESIVKKAKEAKNSSIDAYDRVKAANAQQRNISEEARHMRNELQNAEIKLNKTKAWTEEISETARETKNEALALLNEVNNFIIPQINVQELKTKTKELTEEAYRLGNQTKALLKDSEELRKSIEEKNDFGKELLQKVYEQQADIDDLRNEIVFSESQANGAVNLWNEILESAESNYKLLSDFDSQTQKSKEEAEAALETIQEIEDIILETIAKTNDAQNTLKDAKQNAGLALEKAVQAEDLAKNASSKAEKIKDDAEELYKNTTKLRGESLFMFDRVLNTEGELMNLLEKTKSNESLVNEAKEKVGRAGKDTDEASRKVLDLLGDVESIMTELQNAPEINEADLDRLEAEIFAAEQRIREARLDERLAELQQQHRDQNELIEQYKIEIVSLEKEVDNVQKIVDALPEGCFRQVELEPSEF